MVQKILVVDDEPEIRQLVESRLKTEQYETLGACDGKMCLR